MTEEEKYNYKCRIFSNKDIPFEGLNIKNITLEEVFEIGENTFYQMLLPFCLSLDLYDLNGIEKNIKIFDIILQQKEYKDYLIKSLSILFNVRKGDIVIKNEMLNEFPYISINDNKITRYNFDKLSDIVILLTRTVKIQDRKKIELKKKKTNDEKINKRLENFYKGEKRFQEKHKEIKSDLYNVYKYVSNMDKDFNKALKYNIPQLYDRFYFLNQQDRYRFNQNIVTNNPFVDSKKIDLTPLYNKILE